MLSGSGVVPAEWLDRNGHVNVSHYMSIFDLGNDAILQSTVLGAVGDADDLTMVASRIYIEHKKELFAGETWNLWSGIVTLDRAYVTTTHRLLSGASLRARCDLRAVFFSRRSRAAVSVSDRSLATAQHLLVEGLRDRFEPAA